MNRNPFSDFFLYLIVGGIATIVEWIIFYILNSLFYLHYIPSTIIAYIISTFSNWAAGRLLVFKRSEKGFVAEIFSIYAASIIGLLLNLVIMWMMIDFVNTNTMIAKVVATILVFLWNYIVRKTIIYKL